MDFEIKKLGDLASFSYGKMPKKEKITPTGKYPIFSGYRIVGYYDEYNLEKDCLVVVARGVGGTGDVKLTPSKCYLTNLSISVIPNEQMVRTQYLYYYFLLNNLRYLDSGSAQSQITINDLSKVSLPIPPIPTQDKIVSVLRSLDAKIKANAEINNNLLEQAQALYTSMFITNADPSWQQGRLSDLITVRYGKDHKKLADGVYPVYGSGGIMRYAERPLYEHESVLIPRKGTLNNVMYVNEPFWSVDTMFYTEMRVPNVAKFVYHFVKSKDLASMNAGSAVPSMTTDILNAMELAIPSELALAEFEDLVAPMYRTMKANDIQTAQLINLRDSILPKLMSGELDVSAIEI